MQYCLEQKRGPLTDRYIIFLKGNKSIKCYIWMPWVEKPKKDVIGCEMPRSGASNRDQPGMSEWGNLLCITECKYGKRGK